MKCGCALDACCDLANGRVRGLRGIFTAYVAKFPVLEDQEVLPPTYFLQAGDGPVGEVVDDVGVRLQHAD